ncbi:putative Alpha-amylase [Blattamonas nauphoetae]|uniref:alpha-amylase n=1 Tax=Blattamonas nauphoetae TaxID=2049346 RepID=A0ABQ9YAI1_9EUKA|nr:putative Alpha-amylase [Blattamonas nauphoetae]
MSVILTLILQSLVFAEPEFVEMNGLGRSAQEWKSRIIYQILTDRFDRTDGRNASCNLKNYCGGTFKGIQNHLDYIKALGMDAIWISPVVANTPGSYHGYHATNFYEINSNFGSAQELKDLVAACHQKDIWVMVDIVVNHVGDVNEDWSKITPFNKSEHYHPRCDIRDYNNQTQVEMCRLANLPDLNTENEEVISQLITWTRWLMTTFNLDGLRVDTIKHVGKPFWKRFVPAVPTYLLGETFDGSIPYIKGYTDIMPGQLHYPMYYTLLEVFGSKRSCYGLRNKVEEMNRSGIDVTLLGGFVSNHDNKRFLSINPDWNLMKSAYAFTLLAESIPLVYYGDEHAFKGGDDPNNREPMWTTGFKTDHQIFKFIAAVSKARKRIPISAKLVERWVDDQVYSFSRDKVMAVLTNVGSWSGDISRTITYHPFTPGDRIVDMVTGETMIVPRDGLRVTLKEGCPRVYVKP